MLNLSRNLILAQNKKVASCFELRVLQSAAKVTKLILALHCRQIMTKPILARSTEPTPALRLFLLLSAGVAP